MNETKRKFNWITDTPLWLIAVLYVVFGTITAVGFVGCIHYDKT